MWFRDTLANLVSGLGTAKDKTTGNFHHFTPRNPAEIQAAYRGNWIARKIVDVPAFDMLREWRDWQADDAQRTKIEAAEKALGLQSKYLDAQKRARRDGGSAILIGDGAPDPSKELLPDSIGLGGIRYLTVLGRWEITPGEIERDPTNDWFGQPAYYTLTSAAKDMQRIHPSRVIRLLGAPVLDALQAGGNQGWSDSVLEAVMDAVDQATSSAAYVNAMLPEAKQDVISVPGLSNYLSTAEGTSALTERFAYAARMKSMFGMLLLEGDGKSPEGEVFEQKQISFAGLPDVVQLYLSIAAGAADIPATRLLGKSPDGQNATGDSDTRNYYDRVAAEQKVEFSPRIAPLDELLIRHALGSRPPEVWYQWNPLYQSSQAEKATTLKTMADAIVAINGTGLVPGEVLAQGTKGVLTDSGLLPGIDAAYDEHGDAPLTEGDTNADQFDEAGNPGEGFTGTGADNVLPFRARAAVGDAAPRTLYVSRTLTNAADVLSWAKGAGIPNLMPADSLHVTIAYSRTPIDWMKAGATWQGAELKIDAGGPRLLERFGDALVLLFASDALQYRHREIAEAGASWDHPEYQPHVTLSWDAPGVDVNALAAYNGPLMFGPEIFATTGDEGRAGLTGDAAADLDEEDEATEEEISAVTPERLRALFGAEMLESAGIRRPTQDAALGWVGWLADKARRAGRKPFVEADVSRRANGEFAPKGSGGKAGGETVTPRQTVGAKRLAESGVGGDHGIVVNSARVKKYTGHATVESFVAAHPKGRAHALRTLAADHKAGRIGFASPSRSLPPPPSAGPKEPKPPKPTGGNTPTLQQRPSMPQVNRGVTTSEQDWHRVSFTSNDAELSRAIGRAPAVERIAPIPGDGAYAKAGARAIHMNGHEKTAHTKVSQSTWRHEYGHHLDTTHEKNKHIGLGYASAESSSVRAMALDARDMVRRSAGGEAAGYAQQLKGRSDEEINKVLKDNSVGLTIDDIRSFSGRDGVTDVAAALIARDPKSFLEAASLGRQSDMARESHTLLSDAIEAITLSKIGGPAAGLPGHGAEYYKKFHGSYLGYTVGHGTEAFANYIALRGATETQGAYRAFRHLAPNTSRAYDEIVASYRSMD